MPHLYAMAVTSGMISSYLMSPIFFSTSGE